MNTCKKEIKEFSNKRIELYNKFKKNKNISKEISDRQSMVENLTKQIKAIQDQINDINSDLKVLEDIKNSQKTFIEIDKKIESYIKQLKSNDNLNTWKNTFSKDEENIETNVYSIKNTTYTGSIIVNKSKTKKLYRVDFNFTLSPLLLSFAKEYKLKYQAINDITIKKEGIVLYKEDDVNAFIEEIKNKYKDFFEKEKAPLIKEFKDVNKTKYKASDFIEYENTIIEGYEIVDIILPENSEIIPF